ncbi:hypothetical protein C8J56DRAFT_895962 [Mycena floridula]|nr:hypothetical protein C8J56DRAFT_895962 [Mycena floridula]
MAASNTELVPKHTKIEGAGDMLCSWCYRQQDSVHPLKKCSSCRRSPECQKRDWKHRHKQFCPQFQKVNKYDKEIIGDKALTLQELEYHKSTVDQRLYARFATRRHTKLRPTKPLHHALNANWLDIVRRLARMPYLLFILQRLAPLSVHREIPLTPVMPYHQFR